MSVRPYVRSSVRPSTKSFFDLNEIWYVGRVKIMGHMIAHRTPPSAPGLVFVSRDSELDENLSGDLRNIFSSDLNEIWYVGRGR